MVLCINVSAYTLAVLSNLLNFLLGAWLVEGQANVLL